MYPENKELVDALKDDYVLCHGSDCVLVPYYLPVEKAPKVSGLEQKSKTAELCLRQTGTFCSYCQKERKELKVCSRCKQAFYCDTQCQKNHYPAHKAPCLQHFANIAIARELADLSKDFVPKPKKKDDSD